MSKSRLLLSLSLAATAACGRLGFDDADGDAAAATDALSLGTLKVTNVTLTTFDVEIAFTGGREPQRGRDPGPLQRH